MNFGKLGFTDFPVHFATPLGGALWAVLAGVPVGIIALYFLKLRRRPVQVPSTLLWRQSLEDLHVNSLFQRLRRNLLLFLQLLAIFLAMLALAGPRIQGTTRPGAAVRAGDRQLGEHVGHRRRPQPPGRGQGSGEEGRHRHGGGRPGDGHRLLRPGQGRLELLGRPPAAPEPDRRDRAQREPDLAPRGAPGGGRPGQPRKADRRGGRRLEGRHAQAEDLYRRRVRRRRGIQPGKPRARGGRHRPSPAPRRSPPTPSRQDEAKAKTPSDNVAILALQTRRNDEKPDLYQVFGRVHNYRAEPVKTEAQLWRHTPDQPGKPGTLIDAIALEIPAQSDHSFKFDLPDTGLNELEVRLTVTDALALDNHAFTVVGNPRKAQVLVVTPGNRYLVDTLQTPTALDRADVTVVTPDDVKKDPYARDLRSGRYDLLIADRYRPETPPEANTLYFGVLPPGPAYAKSHEIADPVILDWDVAHPLMQFVRDLPTVGILKAIGVEPPPGSTILIESNKGPLAFVAPREGYSDTVVAFALMDGENFNTNWYRNISFPLFLFNAIQVLGNARESVGDEVHLPGQPVLLRADTPTETIKVTAAGGRSAETLKRTPQGTFVDHDTGRIGLYHARWEPDGLFPFAVNLFDPRESDIAPRGLVPDGVPAGQADAYKIKIGYNPIAGSRNTQPVRKEWWRPLAVVALVVVLVEWYIYNRRVYLVSWS